MSLKYRKYFQRDLQMNKQTNAMHWFVYKIWKSWEKYFLYFKLSVY